MAAIDEVLSKAQLSADERKLLDNILLKNQDLRDGWERLGDYTKKTQELATRKKTYDEAVEYNARMKAWADEKVPVYERLVEQGIVDNDGNELWKAKQSDYERQLTEARKQSVGGDMDPAELDRRVNEIVKNAGVLSKEEMAALINSQAKTLAEETFTAKFEIERARYNSETLPFTAGFSAQMAQEAVYYREVTGERFTSEKQKELYALMQKENDFEPESAMKKYMKPVMDKKATDAEVDRRVAELVAKDRQERGMPGSGQDRYIPPAAEAAKGSIAKMLAESKVDGDNVEARIHEAAQKGASELIADGKYFGQ